MRVKKLFVPFLKLAKFLLVFLILIILLYDHVDASFELKGSSARIHAMGQAYVGLANTPEAIFINCSGLAQLRKSAFSVFYTRPFGMKELNYVSFAAIFPTQIGIFATGITSFGNEIYHEQSLLISMNRAMKQKLYYGFNLHYMKLQINNYGSDFSLKVDAGFLLKIVPNLNWGFFVTNINRASLGRTSENLPQTFSSGISIFPANDLILNIDIYKDSMYPLEFRCGIEYELFNRIALRSGFSTAPSQFCVGFGLLFSYFDVNYAVTTHQSLGLTHHFSLHVMFKQKGEDTIYDQSELKLIPETTIKIKINEADQWQLQQIPGIGPTLAKRIIAYRNQNGPFSNLKELCNIKGISETKLENIKSYLDLKPSKR